MKRIVIWLCKKYGIPTEKTIVKEIVKIKNVCDGKVEGDLTVNGNLIVNGKLTATKGIVCLKNGDDKDGK